MDIYKKGVELDISEDIISATKYYIKSIRIGEPTPDSYINLFLIQWLAIFDLGFKEKYKLTEENYYNGILELSEIIKIGKIKYPENIEFEFWEKYFDNILGYKEFSYKECKDLISKDSNKNLVPYFFLYIKSGKKEYILEKQELVNKISAKLTTKNRYILSVME